MARKLLVTIIASSLFFFSTYADAAESRRFYLDSSGDENILTENIPVIGLGKWSQYYIYPAGHEWTTTIENDLQGNLYFFSFYLGSSGTSRVDVEIVIKSDLAEVVLASTSLIVDSSTYALFEDTVTGIDPDLPSGGNIILRLKSTNRTGLLSEDGRIPYIEVIPTAAPYIVMSPARFGPVQITSFDSPGLDPEGLSFDGTDLWNVDGDAKRIYQLNRCGKLITSFDAPGSYSTSGLAFDGTHLWNVSAFDIYKIDTSGNIIDSFDRPGPFPTGITFDGTYLWIASSWGTIYKLDASGNTVDSFDSPGSTAWGLAFDGTYLWNTDNTAGKIYQLDTSGGIIDSFDSPVTHPTGLAFDGTYLWVVDSDHKKIIALDLPYIKTGLSKTRSFVVNNLGSENLLIGGLVIDGANASDFSLKYDSCSGQQIAPSETCKITVKFSPASEGHKSATLRIPTNDPNTSMLSVLLGGTGFDNGYQPAERADINGDGILDLADAVGALRVLAGLKNSGSIRAGYPTSGVDLNCDNKIGWEEVGYIFQVVSDVR